MLSIKEHIKNKIWTHKEWWFNIAAQVKIMLVNFSSFVNVDIYIQGKKYIYIFITYIYILCNCYINILIYTYIYIIYMSITRLVQWKILITIT